MPKMPIRPTEDIDALARCLRAERPMTGEGFRAWLRANLDVIEDLLAGVWKPGDGSELKTRGRWTYQQIADALTRASIVYGSGRVTWENLKKERLLLIREGQAVPRIGALEQMRRVMAEVLAEHVPSRPALSPTPPLHQSSPALPQVPTPASRAAGTSPPPPKAPKMPDWRKDLEARSKASAPPSIGAAEEEERRIRQKLGIPTAE
jgi:hypothetical protein